VINAHGTCGQVKHNASTEFFVPTKTSVEWNAVLSAASGVSGLDATAFCPPTALTLSHTEWSREFLVSWTGGSGTWGSWGCKLQYNKDGTTWTDLPGTYNCDQDTTGWFPDPNSISVTLPSTNYWTDNFDTTGVELRLALIDNTPAVAFSTNLTCTSGWGSNSSTPNYDEDCDGRWNNTGSEPNYTTVTCSSTSQSWSFPAGVSQPVITTPASSSCEPSTYSWSSVVSCRFSTSSASYTRYDTNPGPWYIWGTCSGAVNGSWSWKFTYTDGVSGSTTTPDNGILNFLDSAGFYSPFFYLGGSGCYENQFYWYDYTVTVPSTYSSYFCRIRYTGVPDGTTTVYY